MATPEEAQSSNRPNLEYHISENNTKQSPEVVRIDGQAAFVVNDHPSSPTKLDAHGAQHDLSIRLPNHKGVVTHVALDVSVPLVQRPLLIISDRRLVDQASPLLSRAGLR